MHAAEICLPLPSPPKDPNEGAGPELAVLSAWCSGTHTHWAPSSSQAALTPPPPGVAACLLLQLCYAFTHWLYFVCYTPSCRQILICFAFVLSPCLSAGTSVLER